MDYLQYVNHLFHIQKNFLRFKPCYKWITFNTKAAELFEHAKDNYVLNLVINGFPSIPLPKV